MEISTATFEAAILDNPGLLILDAWAPRCVPCRALTTILEELAVLYRGRASFARLSVDEDALLASKLGVRAIPTLIFLMDGAEVDRVEGTECRASLKKRIDARLEAAGRVA